MTVDVTQYGASPAASWQTNRDAFQAANDVVFAAGGGRVLVPSGRYNVAGVIQDARVQFFGPGATLIAPDNTSSVILRSRIFALSGTITGNTLVVGDPTGVEVGCTISVRRVGAMNETQTTALTAALTSTSTTLNVMTTRNFPTSGVLRIGDELLLYAALTETSFTGVTRGAFGTIAVAYPTATVVGQAGYLYTEVAAIDGNTLTLANPAQIPGSISVTAEAGILHPSIVDMTFEGGWYAMVWEAVRWGAATRVSTSGSGMGGVQLLHGASDNSFVNIDIRDTGNPSVSMGAGLWMFRGCRRNRVLNLTVGGVGYHGVYIDDRTATGSERDAPCEDNIIDNIIVDIPRHGSNTGVMIVGSSGNQVRGGSISKVRTGVIVDANQITRHDNLPVPARGNLVDGVSIRDTFQGLSFRQPGNRAANIPMWHVAVPVTASSLEGNAFVGVAEDFASSPEPPSNLGSLWLPGTQGNFPAAPESASLHPTAGLDVLALIEPDDWLATNQQILASKWGLAGDRSWYLGIGGGSVRFTAYSQGASSADLIVIASIPAGISGRKWLRGTISFGPNGADLELFIADADKGDTPPAQWTSLGTEHVGAVTGLATSPNPLAVGGAFTGSSNFYSGEVGRVIVRNGLGGTILADANFTNADLISGIPGQTILDGTGEFSWLMRGTEWQYQINIG